MATGKRESSGSIRDPLAVAVERLVELAQPEAVILFGSRADGSAHDDSDVDLLIIARTHDRHRLGVKLDLLWHQLRHDLPGLPPADLLVYTPRQFLASQVVGFVAYQAARQGVVLHGRLPEPAA